MTMYELLLITIGGILGIIAGATLILWLAKKGVEYTIGKTLW